ncbi:methylenetetrahydrofolate--tRNA-(uracil(54)-C(5))-methyltransferase (FADH(2)-oxidizing) TrmFO [bacterium]|nr:methylenetetrahydrofolate--tRNA-(uracil(54)-C(5))-methyltransferase (FADH(2)-oxidizing) TrmFO [bacterium]
MKKVKVIGAGLAGSEAALYLANKGFKVELYEMRPKIQTGAHKTTYPAELVCSNSLGSIDETSASALLKNEAAKLGSILYKIANKNKVPSGNSLSVDRVEFSKDIKKLIDENKNIELIQDCYTEIDTNFPTIIATGPLTEKRLIEDIKSKFLQTNFYFYDAIAPIIEKSSINFEKAFWASRWDKGEKDFINCPMSKEEYENFYNLLVNSETITLHSFEADYFEGCMPIEVMAKRGKDTLRFGPMKPVGLFDRRKEGEYKKSQFYAVVQLRQDDKLANFYNIVGFQTNLKYPEQKKLIHSIPGLENASITRYGQMHANTFINSPQILNKYLQTKLYKNIFFAGQITGTEGYNESISGGLFSAINMARYLEGKKMIELSAKTMLGALIDYITCQNHKNFQPMNANWGIVEEIVADKKILKDKKLKNLLKRQRALEEIDKIIEEINE